MAPRAKKKSGVKDRIKRRVKALRPVEAPLMSKAKTDDPKAQQPTSSDSKGDSKDEAKKPETGAKPEDPKSEAKDAEPKAESKDPEPKAEAQSDAKDEPAQPEAKEEEPSPYAELIPPFALPDMKADADAPAPGLAPPGDSRSFRRTHEGKGEFCLIYRIHRELVVRRGPLGKWGEVDVTQYPTEGAAATAYAHACSDLTGEGFYDLRE